MVQMASQETAIRSGHYAPVVNYGQTPRMPIPEYRQPDVDTKSDWGGAIASAIGSLGQAYVRSAAERDKKQQEEIQQQTYTNLAEKYSKIVEQQRQGVISPFAAETMIRTVDQEGLQMGVGWKDVRDIRNAYAGKLPDLEVERQKYYNKEMWEARTKEMEAISNNNPGFQRLSTDKRYAFMNDTAASLDYIGRMNEQLSTLDPNSDEYRVIKDQYTNAVKDNTSLNLMLYISNEFANEKDIRESTIAEGKVQAVRYATEQLGMSPTEAGVVYDMTVKDIGLDQLAGMTGNAMSLSLKEMQQANDLKLTSTKYRLYQIPQIPVIDALKLTDALNVRVAASGAGQSFVDGAVARVSELINTGDYTEAAREIPVEHVPNLIDAVNNTMSSANASDYMKAKVGNTSLSSFIEATRPSLNDSAQQKQVKFLNMQGIRRGINIDAISNQADIMSKSKDPAVSEEGRQLKDKVVELKAGNDFYNVIRSPWYSAVNSIFTNEDIRNNLRYTQNGELFFKDPDFSDSPILRTLEEIYGRKFSEVATLAFRSDFTTKLLGSKGTLFEKISIMNNNVMNGIIDDPEERKKFYENFGVRAAEAGDTPYDFATDEDNYLTRLKNFFTSNPQERDTSGLYRNGEEGDGYLGYRGMGMNIQNLQDPELRTATATISNSETIGGADVDLSETADLSIWKDVERYQAAQERRTFDAEMDTLGAAMEQIESGGNPNSVSDKGARGLMQLMPKTYEDIAKRYGLPKDGIDDPETNRTAGKLYMQELKERYGNDITKTVAAYNMGPTALDKVISKYPNTWEKHLPKETENHIKKFYKALDELTATASIENTDTIAGASVISRRDLARARVKEAADRNRPVEESEDVKQLEQQLDIEERKSDLQKLIEKVNDEKLIEAIREFIDRNGQNINE